MATLTQTIILQKVIQALRVEAPFLNYFAGGFTNQRLRLGQNAIAHIVGSPTADIIDMGDAASTRNLQGGDQTNTLLTDVEIMVNKEVRVRLSLSRINALQDDKLALAEIFSNAAAAVGKGVVDNILSMVLAAEFTNKTTESIANTDLDTISDMREAMNLRGVGAMRYGLINSSVATSLSKDPQIKGRDYHGKLVEENPYVNFENMEGFRRISEYPNFPANGENLSGFFFDKSAIQYVTAIPDNSGDLAQELGIPRVLKYDVLQDLATGLSLQSVMGQDQNTEEIFMVIRLLTGAKVGDELDGHGQRLASA